MTALWEEVKNQIRHDLPEKSFALWINPLILLEQKEDKIVLGCPNKFSRNWVLDNYLMMIGKKLDHMGYNNCALQVEVAPIQKRRPRRDLFEESKQLTLPNIPKNGHTRGHFFKNEFTFDRFVVGKSNEFAYTVSKTIASGGSCPYQSLFMLANTGLGKSHLSQAIGNTLLDQDSRLRVCYITAEDFVNEMILALKQNQIEDFKNRFRRCCDVLLLEEVQFLGGKQKTQLELGYTLDALSNENKRIIFTSSILPKDIPSMTKQLRSRLMSGIITTIEKPDYETRVKILEKKAAEQKLSLSEEIIHFLSQHLTRDVRQMESALRCIKAKSELLNAKIDMALVKESIRCHISGQNTITVDEIKKLVCQYFKVASSMLRSKSRKKIHTYPRNIFAYLCRHYTDETLENIGRSIDRNHSTVLYASEVIEQKIKVDHKVKKQVTFLEKKLEGTQNDL
jgi:chromosomal replication initiator protein